MLDVTIIETVLALDGRSWPGQVMTSSSGCMLTLIRLRLTSFSHHFKNRRPGICSHIKESINYNVWNRCYNIGQTRNVKFDPTQWKFFLLTYAKSTDFPVSLRNNLSCLVPGFIWPQSFFFLRIILVIGVINQ